MAQPGPIFWWGRALSFPEVDLLHRYPERDAEGETMTHVVPAARQLLTEVEALNGKAEVLDDVDGLGFQRSVRLDKATADKFGDDVLEALGHDARIAEVVKSAKGARVTFVSTAVADYTEPFGLSSVVSNA